MDEILATTKIIKNTLNHKIEIKSKSNCNEDAIMERVGRVKNEI